MLVAKIKEHCFVYEPRTLKKLFLFRLVIRSNLSVIRH